MTRRTFFTAMLGGVGGRIVCDTAPAAAAEPTLNDLIEREMVACGPDKSYECWQRINSAAARGYWLARLEPHFVTGGFVTRANVDGRMLPYVRP